MIGGEDFRVTAGSRHVQSTDHYRERRAACRRGDARHPVALRATQRAELNDPLFGCGLEQCGACTVLRGREAVTSCMTPVSESPARRSPLWRGSARAMTLHPVQQAFIEEQAAQCGYCSPGIIVTAAALLWRRPHPTDEQIRAALDGNLCRCGSHLRILRAVRRADELLWGGDVMNDAGLVRNMIRR